jgi:hypothetical protein
MRRSVIVTGLVAAAVVVATMGPVAAAATTRVRPNPGKINIERLSSGGKAWWLGPQGSGAASSRAASRIAFGSNVDANDPSKDLAAGQAESAIAAAGRRVLVAWNDATGFLVAPSTSRRASLTGVGFSADGGRSFSDLIGLPNNNPHQQWFGDPTVVRLDSTHFVVGSLYLPALSEDCSNGPSNFELAVSVATVSATNTVSFTNPIVTANGGNACTLSTPNPPPDLAFLDKEWLGYDPASRTLAMSYTRFFGGFGGQSGAGQTELVRAHVPTNPSQLRSAAFSAPIVVWPEEPTVVNTGVYVSLAPGGRAYLSWERNIQSNLFNGNPYVYVHAALVPAGATAPSIGGPSHPVVVTRGQVNSGPGGGVKSLDAVAIAGYNRGIGNDFPRVAVDVPLGRVAFEWNDASLHPLGDIWLRTFNLQLQAPDAIRKVNDDNSFALHFLPAVSVRSNGALVSSWYDRRLSGPDSTVTHYFGEVRSAPGAAARDFRITTGPTDWNGTSTLTVPNFGDYTDNTSTGTTSYFTWSDGRLGIPQPFVDSR